MSTFIYLMIAIPVLAFSALVLSLARVLWNCGIDLTVNVKEREYEYEDEDEVGYQKA